MTEDLNLSGRPSLVPRNPIWWQSIEGDPPVEWVDAFEEFTGERTAEHWGLAAAIFIARARKRTNRGPTFSELFRELLPDVNGLPTRLAELTFSQRREVVQSFRLHSAIEWRRRGWIMWDKGIERSLRTGKKFRDESRRYQREQRRGRASEPQPVPETRAGML